MSDVDLLVRASIAGDCTEAVRLIVAGTVPNFQQGTYGRTPLHEAVVHGHRDMVVSLITHGADINAPNAAAHCWTPLHEAVVHAGGAIVAVLIAHGADASAKNADGHTPLKLAQTKSTTHAAALQSLLQSCTPIDAGLRLIVGANQRKWLRDGHYTTGSGVARGGGEPFHYERGIVLNTTHSHGKDTTGSEWSIVAYHGTDWCNLDSILENGLKVGNPTECLTFKGAVHGAGVYCSPEQSYAKLYSRGTPRKLDGGHGAVRLVLGLRIRNRLAITKTSNSQIWVVRNAADIVVQDINLTFE